MHISEEEEGAKLFLNGKNSIDLAPRKCKREHKVKGSFRGRQRGGLKVVVMFNENVKCGEEKVKKEKEIY